MTRVLLPTLLCIAFWPMSLLGVLAQAPDRSPVPDAAAQEQARQRIAEVFQAEYENAKTIAQRSAVGGKLFEHARASQDAVERYVMLATASDIAVQTGDLDAAVRVAEEMSRLYEIDSLTLRARALIEASQVVRSTAVHEAWAPRFAALIDEALQDDQYELGQTLGEAALRSAVKARNGTLRKQVVARNHELAVMARQHADAKDALAVLDQKPLDADANSTAGRFYCFAKGDWEKGLHFLALGSDTSTKTLAVKELRGPETSEARMQLADEWWGHAKGGQEAVREMSRQRATHWYRQALPGLSGLNQARVEKLLQQFASRDNKEDDSGPLSRIARARLKSAPDAVKIGNHYYKIFWGKVSWPDAKAACEAIGGYLVCLETAEEQQKIAALKGSGKVVWVGAFRNDQEKFYWVNGIPVNEGQVDAGKFRYAAFSVGDDLNVRPIGGTALYKIRHIQGFVCEWNE